MLLTACQQWKSINMSQNEPPQVSTNYSLEELIQEQQVSMPLLDVGELTSPEAAPPTEIIDANNVGMEP